VAHLNGHGLCDVNIWIALTVDRHPLRPAVTAWFTAVEEPAAALFCRSTQQSFLRLLTTPALLASYGSAPLTNQQAWTTYDALARDPRIEYRADEPAGLQPLWREFTSRPTASAKLWMDAYLAAFARAGGYQLVTTDGAFRQFAGLDLLVISEEGVAE
jgi:toxin-antitoxin system PIN domain toxin